MDISLDRWLTVFSLGLTVFAIWLAYYFYRKTVRTKLLSISYTAAFPLVLSVSEIKYTYAGKVHESISRCLVLLWNRGSSPIEKTDFIKPIQIQGKNILSISLYEKDPAAAGFIGDDNTLEVELLRPSEAVVFQIDSAEHDYRPDIVVDMKSADMSVIYKRPIALIPAFAGAFGSLALVAVVGYFYRTSGLRAALRSDDGWLYSSLSTFFALIVVALALYVGIKVFRLARRLLTYLISPVAWRFFQIQSKVVSMIAQSRMLKESIAKISDKQF